MPIQIPPLGSASTSKIQGLGNGELLVSYSVKVLLLPGDEFPQPVFGADPEIVLRIHAHCINVVKAIVITARAERHVNPIVAVQPIRTRTGAASPDRALSFDDRFDSIGGKV